MQHWGPPHWLVEAGHLPCAAAQFRASGVVAVIVRAAAPPADLPASLPSELAAAPRLGGGSFLLRRQVARQLAGAVSQAAPESLVIEAEPGGAPTISGTREPLWLSFSCRGDISLVAVAATPVGVDLERDVDEADIPLNMLRSDERSMLIALPQSERPAHFSSLWAMKEAIAKALHLGFTLEPEAIQIGNPTSPAVRINDRWIALAGQTTVSHVEIWPETPVSLALAVLSSPGASAMREAKSPLCEPARWMP